jgi:putative metallopeptidase
MQKYEAADVSVYQTVIDVLKQFPGKFIHIDPRDLHLVFRDSEKSQFRAQTRVLRGFYQSLTQKKVAITFWKKDWLESTQAQRAMVVYHELLHILRDSKTLVYKLRKHDVQDFKEMIETFGLEGEKATEVFKTTVKA